MSTLSEQIQRLQSAKTAIDNSLKNKGIIIPNNATLDTYHSLINSIKTGTSSAEVTATKDNVLVGTRTITSDSNDEIVEGIMPNNGDITEVINSGGTITIPKGFHTGNGIISVRSLAEQTVGTAVANRIANGYTAWVNGIQVTGSMAVTSATGFSAATLSTTSIRISWTNPNKGPWSGVKIRCSTSGYPGVSGGTLVYTGTGSSTSPGSSSYVDLTGLLGATKYYFTAYSYCTGLGDSTTPYNCYAATSDLVLYSGGSLQNGASWVSTYSADYCKKISFTTQAGGFANKKLVYTTDSLPAGNTTSSMFLYVILYDSSNKSSTTLFDNAGNITTTKSKWSPGTYTIDLSKIALHTTATKLVAYMFNNDSAYVGFDKQVWSNYSSQILYMAIKA